MKVELDFTNVPEADVTQLLDKFKREINWIASGARDRYNYQKQLLEDYIAWGKAFRNDLELAGITVRHKNTSYSCWEYNTGIYGIMFYISYVLPQDGSIKSKEDFTVSLVNQNITIHDRFRFIKVKTVEEYKQAIIDIQSPI